jgi:IclR family transcriptional regulator, KDG regulon repressor
MRKRVKESTRHVDAVRRALQVLDCFQVQPLLPLKRICELTGMNRSRVIRLCGTLESKGYLDYEAETRHYRLGSRILSLSKIYESSNNLISLARPILRSVVEQTGESVSLFVVDGLNRMCVAGEEGTFSIRYNIPEGQPIPLYAGAGGKLLLAFGPEELRRKVLRRSRLKRLTAATTTDPKKLEKEFEAIRRRGYASSCGEREPEVAALAAPIYTHEGTVCASLTLAGPIHRLSGKQRVNHLRILLASASRLSQMLGYPGLGAPNPDSDPGSEAIHGLPS